jgi:cbb3-type cytochrome oxidase subunit 1
MQLVLIQIISFLKVSYEGKNVLCNGWPHLHYSSLDTWIQMLGSMYMLVCLACHGGKI